MREDSDCTGKTGGNGEALEGAEEDELEGCAGEAGSKGEGCVEGAT